ncbi:MAG: ATP-binding protein [Candidatus Zixiibacteriota bacterium]|nr:MAG: ATP-binding protein [candidate division Zixibacteria bacterium]
MIMPMYEFTYPSTVASEDKMLDELATVLQANGIPKNTRNWFMLAVSEAFTNALVHGNKRNPRKTIKLVLFINNGLLAADIIDEGQGGLAKIKRRKPPTMLSEGGRGVDLMRHYASAVGFSETESGGLKVSLRFDQMKENEIERYT